MNWVLIRHHPQLRPVYIKWLMLVLGAVTIWLGVMAANLGSELFQVPWLKMSWIWIAPAMYLALGPQNQRAREFTLTLPIDVRAVWRANVGAILLTSGTMMVFTLAVVQFSLQGLFSLLGPLLRPQISMATALLNFWCHGLAWWLLLAALVLNDRPGVANVPRDQAWRVRQLTLLFGTFAGLLGLGLLGPVAALLPFVASLVLFIRAEHLLPPTMTMASREPATAAPRPAPTTYAAASAKRCGRPTWLVIQLATAKQPALQLVAAVILLLLGVMISGWSTFSDAGEHLGVFMVPMVSYCLFALAGAPLLKLTIFDHLPISRRRILASLLLPLVALLAVGFAAGEVALLAKEPRIEHLSWSNEADTYGLRMSPRFFHLAWGDPPENIGPDGTASTPPANWRPFGSGGPVLYKPFHVPEGAGMTFCAWQLERASAYIYNQAVPAAEFRDRFLAEQPDGTVIWRDDAPGLREAHPELMQRRFTGLAQLEILLLGVLFQVGYWLYLGAFRPGVRDRTRKTAFVAILVALMGIYLAPFFLSLAKASDPAGPNIAIIAASEWLATATPGGPVTLWIATVAVLALGHQLVLQRFRRAEWPPVREDDAFCEVMG